MSAPGTTSTSRQHYAIECRESGVAFDAGMSETSVREAMRQNFGAGCYHDHCPPGSHVVLLVTKTVTSVPVTSGTLLNLRKRK